MPPASRSWRVSAPPPPRLSTGSYVVLGILVASILASARLADVNPVALFSADARGHMLEFLRGMVPPAHSREFLRFLVRPTLETLHLSIMGTVLGVLLGGLLAPLATRTLMFRGVLAEAETSGSRLTRVSRLAAYGAARGILNVCRSVPELVWGLLFVRAVGLGAFAGVLAIGIAYGGMLGKVYSEIFESLDPQPLEALQSTGARKAATLLYGVLPQSLPHVVAYTLYRWECAVRSAAILGFVGAGGLGMQIELSMRMFNYHEVMTLLIIILVLVTAIDRLSAAVRRRIS